VASSREWEDELAQLPPAAALRALDLRCSGAAPPFAPSDTMARMKDTAARLFGVQRDLLDLPVRRRYVVEARRAVMAAAVERGIPEIDVAASFGLKSGRTVREACRWAVREAAQDPRFAALLHEVGRVLPRE